MTSMSLCASVPWVITTSGVSGVIASGVRSVASVVRPATDSSSSCSAARAAPASASKTVSPSNHRIVG